MRLFIIILAFAIGFSGFLSTAHAFEIGDCNSSEIGEQCLDANSVVDHESASKDEKQTDTKEAKHLCVSCGHCSSAHIVSIGYTYLAFMFFKTGHIFIGYNEVDVVNQLIYTIKRPPKFIV